VATVLLTMTTLMRCRVNPMQGLVHLTFFLTWLMVMFD